MKWLKWNDPAWCSRFFTVLAFIIVINFAVHPELRMLVPFLDATGLEVIFTLLSLQILRFFHRGFLVQFFRVGIGLIRRRVSSSAFFNGVARFLDLTMEQWCGYLGHYAWVRLHYVPRAAALGPNYSCMDSSRK